jgi:hypothetical protein
MTDQQIALALVLTIGWILAGLITIGLLNPYRKPPLITWPIMLPAMLLTYALSKLVDGIIYLCSYRD